jgi:uncharacterized repeat protein (TIGR01451 family)
MTIARHLKQVSLALPVLGSFGLMQSAFAVGTDSGVSITNRATVSYSVGSVAQTPIESSPTGNSNPGVNNGANTSFVVDNKILHVVSEVGAAVNPTSPGAADVVATFLVTNQGNTSQGYLLTAINQATGTAAPSFGTTADNSDVSNLRIRVEAGAVPGGNPAAYDSTDIATNINSLAEDANVRVYVLADVPLAATNGQFANVRLAAQATNNGTTTVVTQTAGADNPAVVDVVFADVGATARDGIHEAIDQYSIASAALSVSKISSVISDPFNNTTNPKAIPGAVVQYAVTVTNSGASAASGVAINDPLPTNTTFLQGGYPGATDVEVQVGPSGTPTRCVAETPSDTNVDGCFRTVGGQLVVQAPMSVGTVNTGAANAVTVRFRVTIN